MIILQKKTQKKHNPNWQNPGAASSVSGKTSAFFNLIKTQDDHNYNVINKVYLYVKDLNEAKYQYFIKKHENIGLKNLAIQRLSLNVQMILRMSIKILQSTTQVENLMY